MGADSGVVGVAPRMLGEHTNEILKELEYSQAEIERLAGEGVVLQHVQ